MRDETEGGESRPVNKRNLLIALGAIGAIVLVSNLDGPSINIGDEHDVEEAIEQVIEERSDRDRDGPIVIGIGDDEASERIEAATNRLEEKINAKVARELERAADEIDDAEMDAAVEDLKDGDPERFLEMMDKL